MRTLDGRSRHVHEHPDLIRSVDLSLGGALVVTACSDGRLRVFPTAGGAPRVLDAGVRFITAMLEPLRPDPEAPAARRAVFSPDGSRIASLADDGAIRIWPVNTPEPPVELTNAFGAECIAFDQTSSAVVAGTDQGTASIYHLAPPTEPLALPQFANLHAAAADERISVVAAVPRDGTVHLWHAGRSKAWQKLPAAAARACAFRPESRELATAHADGHVRVWSPDRLVKTIRVGPPLEGVEYSPAGDALYAWSRETVHRIDGTSVRPFAGPPSQIWSVSVSADGRRLLVTYENGLAVVHDTTEKSRSAILPGHRGAVLSGALDPTGARAVTGSEDGTARLWRIEDRDLDDRRGENERDVEILRGFPPGTMIDRVAMSRDGRRFAIVTSEGRALVFPARGGRPRVLRAYAELAHVGVIYLVSFSGDGSRLLTSSAMEGLSRLWDLDGDTKPAVLAGHAATIIAHELSHDGSRVMSASENGRVLLFTARFEDLVAATAARTTATLTVDQRITLLGESPDEAYENYARAERRQGRTPLPPDWSFEYPTW